MARYILRYTGAGPVPVADMSRIEARDGVRVLDRSGRMVLVELESAVAHGLSGELSGWVVEPEVTHPVPDTRPAPRHSPDGG